MSYEKRPNKRKVPPSKQKSIIEDELSGARVMAVAGPSAAAGRDPLASSPVRRLRREQTSAGELTSGIRRNVEMDEEEVAGVLVFDETEVDMEHAEVYHGDGQADDQEQMSGNAEESDDEVDDNEDFEEKLRKNAWLGLPNRVLNKVYSEAELQTKLRDRKVDTHEDDDEEEWETMSESSTSSGEMDPDGDWEESLVYVELDDLPNIQELFAVHPDDFLRFQHRNKRHRTQPVKATHSKLNFQFHNFTSTHPTLQIGQRYFAGQWEEPTGSAVFFRRNGEIPEEESGADKSSVPGRPCEELKSIVPEPEIPFDPVFMKLGASYKNAYECVAVADKVLKMSAHIASTKKMPKTVKPGGGRLLGGTGLNVPKGYTARAILAGHYKPMRKYVNKKYKKGKVQKWKAIQGELTILNEGDEGTPAHPMAGTSRTQDDAAEEDTEVILS